MRNDLSPLSSLMLEKANQNKVDPAHYNEKKESLMSAYEKLIQAQRYKNIPVRNFSQAIGGTAGLMKSGNPSLEAYAAAQAARLGAMAEENQAMQSSEQNQAKTFLDQQKLALSLLEGQKDAEYKYLKEASDADYKDQIRQIRQLSTLKDLIPPPEVATKLGVPAYAGPNPYEGLDKVGQRQLRMGFEKQLQAIQEEAKEAKSATAPMKRFRDLNELAKDNLIGTGPIADFVPNWSDELQEMETKAAEMIPQMRVPGSGSTSDFDARMFTKATVGTQKDYGVNKNVAEAFIASKENQMQRAAFMEQYLSANGHLRGAEQMWQKYLDSNPIFKDEDLNLNEKRKTWQDYFRNSSATPDEEKSPSGIPKGWDPEDWKQLTPEEQSSILKKRG